MNSDSTEIVGVELPLADTHLSQQTEFGFIELSTLVTEPKVKSDLGQDAQMNPDMIGSSVISRTEQNPALRSGSAPENTNASISAISNSNSNSNVQMLALGDHLPAVLVDVQLLQELASIPDRLGFKIGDVADLLGIKQYILRYWEQEFDLLRPKKASNNQRLYTKRDVENAFLIRKLLYRDKFSIEGARQAIRDVKFAVKKEKEYSTALVKLDENHSQLAADARDLVKRIRQIKEVFL